MKIVVLTGGSVAPGMNAAVEALADGEHETMVGIGGEEVRRVSLEEVVGKERPLDPDMYELAQLLAEMPE
jgi:6-phosphofructokinase 1